MCEYLYFAHRAFGKPNKNTSKIGGIVQTYIIKPSVPVVIDVDLIFTQILKDIYPTRVVGFVGDVKFINPITDKEEHSTGEFELYEGHYDEEYLQAGPKQQLNYGFQQDHLIFIVDYRPALIAQGVEI